MRKTLSKFEYLKPATIDEAVSLLCKYGERAKVLAGGTDLIPLIRNLTVKPDYVVDLSGISKLSYIVEKSDGLRIGAMTTIREIEKSKLIQNKYVSLHEAAHEIGGIQIKCMATIGGNLCRASPSADMATPLLTLNAKLTIIGKGEEREIPIEKFFTEPGKTALQCGEILTEIRIPPLPKKNIGMSFVKIGRTAQDIAIVNGAVALIISDGVFEDVRIALGGVAPTPIRTPKAEKRLKGKKYTDEIVKEVTEIASDETKPITDVRSTAEYRKEVSKVVVKRALKKALLCCARVK